MNDKFFEFNDGHRVPKIGFGTWRIKPEDTKETVTAALKAGYRHIDTAMIYQNEEGVGGAVNSFNLPRSEIFVTSKLWNDDIRARNTKEALKTSLRKLNMDYLDLYLIHWPCDGYIEAYQEMEELQKQGLIKSIGVSNFLNTHLDNLMENSSVVPAMNQFEHHPYLTQQAIVEYNFAKDILVTAYCPLGKGNLVNDVTVNDIADSYGKTAAQVLIRWHYQRGIIPIPRSSKPERIASNFDIFDFELTDEDIQRINSLNQGLRFCDDPDSFDF